MFYALDVSEELVEARFCFYTVVGTAVGHGTSGNFVWGSAGRNGCDCWQEKELLLRVVGIFVFCSLSCPYC